MVLSDILLQTGTNPIVTGVEPRLKGLFLSGVNMNNEITASVDWNGWTAGSVNFLVNDTQVESQTGSGPEYVITMDMGDILFEPSFDLFGNYITVQAVASTGESSDPFKIYVGVLPVPTPLQRVTSQGSPFSTFPDGHIALDFNLPNPPIEAVLTFPVIGRFGFELAANASFDYTVADGDWETALGIGAEGKQGKRGQRPGLPGLTRVPKMKLYIGQKEISGKIQAGVRGTATIQQGITFNTAFGHGEIAAKLELGRVGLLDLLGPGLSSGVSSIPGLGELTKTISVTIYVIPGVDGEITFALQPAFAFNALEMTGKVGLEAAYEPKLSDSIKMRLYVGGEPSVTLGVPGDLFKNLKFRAYAGAAFEAWVFKLGPVEYVFVDVAYPASGANSFRLSDNSERSVVQLKVASPDSREISPISRDYLKKGKEGFSARDGKFKGKAANGTPRSALEAFRNIGKAPAKGSVTAKAIAAKTQSAAGDEPPSDFSQVDLTIATNVFPGSEPALANKGQELMLLYVTDNGTTNGLQFTDIRWTRWNGTDWSVPTTLHTNTQAEFAPKVAYDGNGNAIAVWERVADANFNETNLTAMAAQMEIVWSKWNYNNNTWSAPVALTTNGVLDHAPMLCGPMADGSVLAVWTRNESNLLMGTNGAGNQVLAAQWNSTNQSWSSPQTLIVDLPFRLSQSFAGTSNRAVYAWTRDLDGVLTNANDQQVFYCEWTNGVWGLAQQFTTNSFGNRNARVAVCTRRETFIWFGNRHRI